MTNRKTALAWRRQAVTAEREKPPCIQVNIVISNGACDVPFAICYFRRMKVGYRPSIHGMHAKQPRKQTKAAKARAHGHGKET